VERLEKKDARHIEIGGCDPDIVQMCDRKKTVPRHFSRYETEIWQLHF